MLEQVLSIQAAMNQVATQLEMPAVNLINEAELTQIKELIAAKTFPDKWDGTEPHGDELFDAILPDGSIQPLLF
jgi:DNA sulfur modification protein DndC